MKPTDLTTGILVILFVVAITASASFAADFNVVLDETFTITLPSNPSTGYSWTPDYDSNYLELVNESFNESDGGIGSGGNETFVFKAIKAGETNINFAYEGVDGNATNNTTKSVSIVDPNPTNATNTTPSNNDTGIPQNTLLLIVLVVIVLAVAAGIIVYRKRK